MDIELSTVLKWVVTILVTGFIAQFGKMLAKSIVGKIKSRKSGDRIGRNETMSPAGSGFDADKIRLKREKEILKAGKKRLKAEQKRAKKAEGDTQ